MYSKEYRSTILRDAVNLTDSEIVDMVACGFNYPPSQYQLHLQFMLPPFLPFQHLMYLVGNHFTKGRFFPCVIFFPIFANDNQFRIRSCCAEAKRGNCL